MNLIIETLRKKWAKYLLEVIVIVGSILGAFALDRWNEAVNEREKQLDLYESIVSDLAEDSVQMAGSLAFAKKKQHWHKLLYVKKENISTFNLDSTSSEILEFVELNSTTWDNNNSIVEYVKNLTIRNRINKYFTILKVTRFYTDLHNGKIINNIRPYMVSHSLLNSDVIFNSNPYKQDMDPYAMIVGDEFMKQIGSQELNQIMIELYLGNQDVIQYLEALILDNSELRKLLNSEIQKLK